MHLVSDVLVIGGGVIGCGIARALTARGAAVTLIDPRSVGHGASRASAGMLAPFSEGRHDAALQALGARSLSRYEPLAHALADEGRDVPFARTGSIDVAFDADGATALEDVAAALRRDRIACEPLDRSTLRALEPAVSPGAVAGLMIPSHCAVDVPALVSALWHSAASRGARLIQTRARRISPAGSGVRVTTDQGAFEAPRVVLAAGCWAGQIEIDGVSPLPVQPVRGQLLALRTEPAVLAHTLWSPGCYLVPWSDGTILVGATVEHVGFDERATAAGVSRLLQAATLLLPPVADAAFVEVRVGLRPATLDDRPIVGESPRVNGLIYATGHYRNGALLMPLTAEAVAELVAGTPLDPIWAPCDPQRFGAY
jgi:glycine oxidase